MNKKAIFILLFVCVLALSGCGKSRYPDLPENAIAFKMGTFEDAEHDSALFGTLEYNGRTYILYGTTSNAFKPDDVDHCIGYIVMDENSTSNPDPNDNNTRVYTLVGDSDQNFLMDYTEGPMNQVSFWRAIDTKDADIEIPKYISVLEYDFWK